uniref:CCHC-type domain-containing protein n=1 Tax=Rhizophagus irregularis (strain DAOM 181602 / DAOM 197198 / MUCL 43194) TaxID=747089 RepID=U9TPK3_RHIID
MGVTVSTEDVSLLQDFGSKSKEEQEKVIEKAGFVVEETDKRIAEYMALADSQAVVVQRLCELVYNKTKDSMIEEAQQQMVLARQEWEQHTEIKERSMKQELQKLLDVVNKKDYLISHETSVVEEITSTNESERSGASNGNGLFEGQNFYNSDSQSSGFNERLHKELNIGSCVIKSDTNENEMKEYRRTYIVVAVSSNDEVEKILDTSGKDREFPYKFIPIISLNATLNEQVIWLTKVDKSFSQQEVCEAVINTLGEVQHIKKIEYRYNNSFRVTIKVTCSDVTFNNTWSIEIGKGRAEVWPERLSTEEKKKRKTFKAWINNVDKDTTESSFTRQLYNFNAKSWLLVDSGNTLRLEVTFDNNQDMLRCVKKEFVFEGRGYRWEMENNDNKQIRNFNKSIKKEREIMCYNCGSMGHMAKFCQNNNFQQQGYRNQERVKSEEIGLRCYSCARDCRNEYSNSFNGTGKQGYKNQEKFQSQNHQRQDYNIEYQRGNPQLQHQYRQQFREQRYGNRFNQQRYAGNGSQNGDKNIKKLAVYNVQGLGKEDKYGLLVDALKENKWDILGLCETKLKSEAAKFRFIGLDNYISYSACNENSSKEGVTLLIKKLLAYHVTNIERIEGVAIKVDLVFKNKVKNFRCILIYRPIEKLENVVKVQEIQDKLTKWNDCDYDKWDLVVMGDLNEHYKVEEFLDKGLNSVKGKKCKIINCFNVDSNFTWKSEDFKAFEFEDFVESDHRLIEIKLKDINEEIKEREEVTLDVSEVSTILDRNKVQEKWKEFAEIIENKLKVSIANEYDMGIEGTWKMIKDCFMEGEKILPKKEIKKMRVSGNDLLLRDKEFKKILQIYQRSKKIRTRFKKLKKVIAMQLDEISQIDKVLYDNNRKIINHNNLTMQEEYKFNTYKLEEINQENWESLNNKVGM